jgi:D-tyrosyl-tRNA(Tyr) deacylase
MAERIAGLRIFPDAEGKMNRDLKDAKGSVLAVSQFTLLADCRKGRRPDFVAAAPPEEGRRLFDLFVVALRRRGLEVATGVFGAEMSVELVNEGPATFVIDRS